MRKFRPLQEPIRLQDLLNSTRSRAEKKIDEIIFLKKNVIFFRPENEFTNVLSFLSSLFLSCSDPVPIFFVLSSIGHVSNTKWS